MGNLASRSPAQCHASEDLEKKYAVTDTQLGYGMNGSVFLAIGQKDTPVKGRKFAIKTFLHNGEERCLSNYRREAWIFRGLDHPNIARLVDIYEGPESLDLVMECLEGGEVLSWILDPSTRGGFTEHMAKDICRQMVTAVAYLHGQETPILHKDIKPDNFMFEKKYDAGSTSPNKLKLIDFGLSSWTSDHCGGTPEYESPQQFRNRRLAFKRRSPYTMKDDIFSLGVTAYVLLTGKPAYTSTGPPELKDMYKWLPRSYEIKEFTDLSAHAQSFVMSLMEFSGDDRPTAVAALDHPWLKVASSTAAAPAVSNKTVRGMCDFMAASGFRRKCMNMMAWSLTSADRTALNDRFRKLDTNNDGMISLVEINNVLQKIFQMDENAKQELGKLSAACGSDMKVSYSDFLAMALNDRVIRRQDALWGAFDRLDAPSEGFVTFDGVKKVFCDEVERAAIEEFMREVGIAGTGRISKQDFLEYLTWTSPERQYRHILLSSAEKLITKELKAKNDDHCDAGRGAKWVPLKRQVNTSPA